MTLSGREHTCTHNLEVSSRFDRFFRNTFAQRGGTEFHHSHLEKGTALLLRPPLAKPTERRDGPFGYFYRNVFKVLVFERRRRRYWVTGRRREAVQK